MIFALGFTGVSKSEYDYRDGSHASRDADSDRCSPIAVMTSQCGHVVIPMMCGAVSR